MRKRSSKTDINQTAASIVARASASVANEPPREKNPAAVALGKLGGLKGGNARAAALNPARRKEIARKAAEKRWGRMGDR